MRLLSALNLKTLSSLLAIVSLTNAAAEEDAIASPDSAVVKLTQETFSKYINENPLVLAEFFAPWCGHCKALGPNFAKAADILDSKNIQLAQIDCTEEQELCQEHGIRGYPTLKVFRGESDPSDYEGPRSADGIVDYMIKQSLPPVSLLEETSDIDDFISEASAAVIVETGSKQNETFYKLSALHRDEFSFVQTSNKDYTKKYGKDKFLVFLPDTKDPVIYKGDESYENLVDWLSVETKPLFGELDGSTYQSYMTSNLPLAYLFYNTPEEREEWKSTIEKIAKEQRGKINFVGLDASKYGRHAENLNMDQDFPLFVIHDISSNKKFGFPQDNSLSIKTLPKFIQNYSSGKLEPKVKSEEIPTKQETSVLKIVGKTHDQIVKDETKDVLVKYYAPWCGHCKRLAPIYEELADKFQSSSEAKDKVIIANVDATLNDVDVDISGYPTLILYPANDKSNPIVHQGGRDLESLASFIKESGSFKVDIDSLEADVIPVKESEETAASKETDITHDEL
ncbi:putative secreted protein [Wickerhamomyces ciferrii]|uniref:Protein disulfide-isomerase n=1 Tax=Wickerhamomyces ciferrii (strain ATCC 14091 / BCRC 22168 / CBS 111 / JCM 3599 / NBRC 0793 / NRRL Y-1031 F-60-10) TaxID=1206466 RepID=K0KYD4_WICCF|nr:uncharacterized protein BN7_6048 [Wickerhamomyces ciferrii]CCH46454.1 putative secreted protein [Wickerhamomyces ciferrii]